MTFKATSEEPVLFIPLPGTQIIGIKFYESTSLIISIIIWILYPSSISTSPSWTAVYTRIAPRLVGVRQYTQFMILCISRYSVPDMTLPQYDTRLVI